MPAQQNNEPKATLFGIPIVVVDDLPEPVFVLGDWHHYMAFRIVDGSGKKVAEIPMPQTRRHANAAD